MLWCPQSATQTGRGSDFLHDAKVTGHVTVQSCPVFLAGCTQQDPRIAVQAEMLTSSNAATEHEKGVRAKKLHPMKPPRVWQSVRKHVAQFSYSPPPLGLPPLPLQQMLVLQSRVPFLPQPLAGLHSCVRSISGI